MKISIVTVCWNSAATIKDTLESVNAQSYLDVEHIIVDGCSTDSTLSIVESFGRRVSNIISEPDDGLYDAMNKGIHAASGDVIAILNSDDCYSGPDVISRVMKEFTSRSIDAVYTDLAFVEASDLRKQVRYWRSSDYEPGAFLSGWHPPHPTFFAKKQCYEKFGGFNTSLKVSADFELMLRFFEVHNITSVYLPFKSILMRIGGESTSSVKLIVRGNRNVLKAF